MAYYSNEGANIYVGAAGLGSSRRGIGEAGMLRAFKDGSLGAADSGLLAAYQDGSLGAMSPLTAFKDGSLGMPLFMMTQGEMRRLDEPVALFHGGTGEYFQATGEYFAANGCRGCGGLGQVSAAAVTAYSNDPNVVAVATAANATAVQEAAKLVNAGGPSLDLSDPAALQEFKIALAVAPWTVANIGTAGDELEKDFASPFWTTTTTQLVDAWITGMPVGEGRTSSDQFAELDAMFPLPHRVPADAVGVAMVGITAIGMTAVNPPIVPPGTFPILQQYLTEVSAAGGGQVLPPKFAGQGPSPVLLGLGVAAAAMLGFAVFGKKKRR